LIYDVGRLTGPHISDDTAHVVFPPVRSASSEALATSIFCLRAATGHCACPLYRRLPGGFVRCACSQEGKRRAMAWPGRHPPIWFDFPPACLQVASVSPALQRGTSSSSTVPRTKGGMVQALSSPSRSRHSYSRRSTTSFHVSSFFTGRDLKAEQLDPAEHSVSQGPWSWQAVVFIIA
jgi:hypothetical protein